MAEEKVEKFDPSSLEALEEAFEDFVTERNGLAIYIEQLGVTALIHTNTVEEVAKLTNNLNSVRARAIANHDNPRSVIAGNILTGLINALDAKDTALQIEEIRQSQE